MAYFWLNDENKINEWKSTKTGRIYVSNEYFFNNSNIMLGQDHDFRDELLSYLSGVINIKPTVRSTQRTVDKKKLKKYYKGIDITELNSSLRSNLGLDSNLLFEVYNDDGIFYTSNAKKGFDFAKIDTTYNLVNL